MRCGRGITVDIEGVQRGDGAPAREGARLLGRLRRCRHLGRVVSASGKERRHGNFSDSRPRSAEGVVAALAERRQGGRRACQPARARRGDRQPDAVFWRIRRPGRRHRALTGRWRIAFRVSDTERKAGDLFLHRAPLRRGTLSSSRRRLTSRSRAARRHPAEPFRHPSAARGAAPGAHDHVAQKGSLVAPGPALRFSHPKLISQRDRVAVEDIANGIVIQNSAQTTRPMAFEDAPAPPAPALFMRIRRRVSGVVAMLARAAAYLGAGSA